MGTYKVEGADQAKFNANNYINKPIVDFETNLKKTKAENLIHKNDFEFMEKPGKTITKIFSAKTPEANPPRTGHTIYTNRSRY